MRNNAIRTRFLQLALGALALAASATAMAEVVLYEDDNFAGATQRIYLLQDDLARVGFNDTASSVVVRSGNWQLCSDARYGGQCITLGPGRYRSLREMDMNDRISSVRPVLATAPGGGWGGGNGAVALYEDAEYAGRSINSSGSRNLQDEGFNDQVSSIVVRSGRWEFCTDADFRGRCTTLGPGRYRNLKDMGINDAISSFRPAGGMPGTGGGRPRPPGWSADDGRPPDIAVAGNRTARATYRTGCVVYFNAEGRRFKSLPSCSADQLTRAEEALQRHLGSQGGDSYSPN